MRAEGAIVCIDGIDGSGKTTHSLALVRYLRAKGLKAIYLKPLYLGFKEGAGKRRGRGSLLSRLHRLKGVLSHRSGPSSLLVKGLLTIAVVLYAFFVRALVLARYRRSGYIIICDRYFYYWAFVIWGTSALKVVRSLPRPDRCVILNLPLTSVIKSRIHEEHDRLLPLSYYALLHKCYLLLGKLFGFPLINTAKDLSEVRRDILRVLGV